MEQMVIEMRCNHFLSASDLIFVTVFEPTVVKFKIQSST